MEGGRRDPCDTSEAWTNTYNSIALKDAWLRVMDHRERILNAIRGVRAGAVPWAPRLDFWHRARLREGTLPEELRGLDLVEIARKIGAAAYATIPDFTTSPDGEGNRTLGMLSWADCPYDIEFDGVERRITAHRQETEIEYRTSAGTLRTATIFTDEMLDGGASVSWITKHAIERREDFAIVGEIFSRMRVVARPERYERFRERLGGDGLAVAHAHGTSCPVHLIMKELMPTERFFYALADWPEAVERLAEQIEPAFSRIREIALDLPAEVVYLGANYDDSITHPAFYRKYFLPHLRSYAEELHARGKYLMTHTDGENRRLLGAYLETGFDVADSVCPYPMTRCHIEELRAAFEGHITIWGGLPSILLCRHSANDAEFRAFVDRLLEQCRGGTRFVLGVSDMVTADVDWDRVVYVGEAVGRLAN